MAKGSEQISARWVEGAERVCVECGAPIRNLARDVGQVHTDYDARGRVLRRWVRCMACRPGQRRDEARKAA